MSAAVNRFPPGWDEARVRDLIEHYESQTEDEAVAEDNGRRPGGPRRITASRPVGPVGMPTVPGCVKVGTLT